MKYGIGEWYGTYIKKLPNERKEKYANTQGINKFPCPFQKKTNRMCNKAGGVCTLAVYDIDEKGNVMIVEEEGLVTTCPNRFLENQKIFKEVGKSILDTDNPYIIKEVPFLKGVDYAGNKLNTTVGRIDMVLAKLKDKKIEDWCALEMQAVYFSGSGMNNDFKKILHNPGTLQYPAGHRRPDFRSSAPKRLMPQLQIKVPSLRRWGKKIAVVIDFAFYKSIAPMNEVEHLTNADIIWFVCDYKKPSNELSIIKKVYTTLESSVEGLTAGVPVSKEAFEKMISKNIIQNSSKIIPLR